MLHSGKLQWFTWENFVSGCYCDCCQFPIGFIGWLTCFQPPQILLKKMCATASDWLPITSAEKTKAENIRTLPHQSSSLSQSHSPLCAIPRRSASAALSAPPSPGHPAVRTSSRSCRPCAGRVRGSQCGHGGHGSKLR